MRSQLRPTSLGDAASALAGAAAEGKSVRILGAGTKQAWGSPLPADPDVELSTAALDRIVEHNEGDLTAVLEAGVPLSLAQQQFASAGQRVALDPWLGAAGEATVGGIVATGDSGPLRHRYGAPRDLVLGMTVALSDGTIARSGGKVIKNVAGYDVAKLFCGSFGTLGLILSVNLRLHPLPVATATAVGRTRSINALATAARTLAGLPLELEALDVAWRGDHGSLLARCGGVEPDLRAARAVEAMREAGLDGEIVHDDAALWEAQRAGQRSTHHALVRVRTRPSLLNHVLAAARDCRAELVGRAALGESFVEVDPAALPDLRSRLPAGAVAVLADCPAEHRGTIDPWGEAPDGPALELMRRIKARFDPAAACNRGIFVGGI